LAWARRGVHAGTSLDNWIILPLTTYVKDEGTQQRLLRVTVRAGSAAKIQDTVDEVAADMRGRHICLMERRRFRAGDQRFVFVFVEKTSAGVFFW